MQKKVKSADYRPASLTHRVCVSQGIDILIPPRLKAGLHSAAMQVLWFETNHDQDRVRFDGRTQSIATGVSQNVNAYQNDHMFMTGCVVRFDGRTQSIATGVAIYEKWAKWPLPTVSARHFVAARPPPTPPPPVTTQGGPGSPGPRRRCGGGAAAPARLRSRPGAPAGRRRRRRRRAASRRSRARTCRHGMARLRSAQPREMRGGRRLCAIQSTVQ